MIKLCECGCGNPAPIAKQTDTKHGRIKGAPTRFISGHNGVGDKNGNWKGGITDLKKLMRKTARFAEWRTLVFERDGYACQKCEDKGGRLHPHHIRNFDSFPMLRFEVSNGITFCTHCHILFHKTYGYTGNDKGQLRRFIGA